MNVKTVINAINPRDLTSNTQKVAYKLLKANGSWISRSELRVANSPARARDLRKQEFGKFKVECEQASSIKKGGTKSTFFYRINPNTVTNQQIKTVFRSV
jgi:hypothetical protein